MFVHQTSSSSRAASDFNSSPFGGGLSGSSGGGEEEGEGGGEGGADGGTSIPLASSTEAGGRGKKVVVNYDTLLVAVQGGDTFLVQTWLRTITAQKAIESLNANPQLLNRAVFGEQASLAPSHMGSRPSLHPALLPTPSPLAAPI